MGIIEEKPVYSQFFSLSPPPAPPLVGVFSGSSDAAVLCFLEEILTMSWCSQSFAGMCHSLGKDMG